MQSDTKILHEIFEEIKERVDRQLEKFRYLRDYGMEEEIFEELVFCLLTPQSKARMAEKVIENLKKKGLLFDANFSHLSNELNLVRFKNHKATYILEAQSKFIHNNRPALKSILSNLTDTNSKREWLFKNVKGIGMKEASHFLRNIGYYADVAILDRHILRNLINFGIIENVSSLNLKNYISIENKMKKWATKIKIPFEYLDFILWYKETDDIFK
ncbi:MAG: N-glycosylase/DNA lyase [Brevinematia bacterium]